jgi:hypothetical protein
MAIFPKYTEKSSYKYENIAIKIISSRIEPEMKPKISLLQVKSKILPFQNFPVYQI